jgi:hypothetical protein
MYLTHLRMIALLSIVSISSGCSLLQTKPEPIPVEIKTVQVRIPITQPSLPRPIDMKEPYWYVVSSKNIDEFLVNIAKESGNMVFFAMSPADYELMAYNLQEIKRYVKELKEVVIYYKRVTTYDDVNTTNPGETENVIK